MAASGLLTDAIETIMNSLKDFKLRLEERRTQARTMRELGRLSNHDLHDIGICRGDIRSIANGTFYSDRIDDAEIKTHVRGYD
tara:strand:+ start:2827 stop:3075 length:249 start_codon:yes stop_codon:yes gene_type:complete